MVGLPCAGKTTILHGLQMLLKTEIITSIPSIGFNVQTFSCGRLNINCFDVDDRKKIEKLWDHYYVGINGIVFVFDSSDQKSFPKAKNELKNVILRLQGRLIPLLILANKQDIPGALPPDKVARELGIGLYYAAPVYVQGTIAIKNEGIFEGLRSLGIRELF